MRNMDIPVQNPSEKVRIFQELCKGVEECGICLHVCRRKLLQPAATLNRKGFRPPEIASQESCALCRDCMISCPDMAVVVTGRTPKRRVNR